MKSIIITWIFVAIFFAPFHYYSGAYDIRSDMRSPYYAMGRAFGEAIRWPFYFFMDDITTGKSNIDSKNENTF